MRNPTLPRLLVVLALAWGGATLAQQPRRHVQDFNAPREMTAEEREIAKQRAMGNNLNSYGKDIQVKEKPVPWMAIGLASLVFLVAVPFGLRAYRGTTKDISDQNTFGVNTPREGAEE